MLEDQQQNLKCSSCNLDLEYKLKSNGSPYKTCIKCNSRNKIVNSIRCPHQKFKYQCYHIDCVGSSLCKIHNRPRHKCKDCIKDNKEQLVNIIIKTFINCSLVSDKKYNRLDLPNFIDSEFCKLLINESNYKCCYCKCDLELVTYGKNLISIERIDNKIGHIKSNVKIACLFCNKSQIGHKNNLEVNLSTT
jgi:hypothetical protein